jgi:hypothetical protein
MGWYIAHGPTVFMESPVEKLRKTLPRGDASWSGYAEVYIALARIADKYGADPKMHGYGLHITTMAVMGTGHEETMRKHLALLNEVEYRPANVSLTASSIT